jgi:hypothetical protein
VRAQWNRTRGTPLACAAINAAAGTARLRATADGKSSVATVAEAEPLTPVPTGKLVDGHAAEGWE